MGQAKKERSGRQRRPGRLLLAAIGLESEFALTMDGAPVRPEDVFGDPRGFIRGPLVHRRGTSYHLPTGGAVYFDTGVLELATPVIEIERGCAARAGRSLWEGIRFVRSELDAWQAAAGHEIRMVGFSTHYNVSIERARPPRWPRPARVERLAYLLSHILPVPVMLLATNRRSTGVGVRPRGDRIEVTADFTPSAPLMIAAATVITGISRAVMRWRTFEPEQLERKRIPVLDPFTPLPHTSRSGWLAGVDSYGVNPFVADIDEPAWRRRDGRAVSLRSLARTIVARFWPSISALADPFSARLIRSVLSGRSASLLDLDDRPPEYEDVGRLCRWDETHPAGALGRSRYERILLRAIAGARVPIGRRWYTPVGMRGWSEVVLRRQDDGTDRIFPIDVLLRHLEAWERRGNSS